MNYKYLLKNVAQFKGKFSILFFCIITTSFIGTSYPYIFGRLVDEVFYKKNMSVFIKIVIMYGVVYITEQLLHLLLNITWAQLMTRFLFVIRKDVFMKTLSLKPEFLTNMHTGDIIKRINGDTEEFMKFIHWNIFYTIANILRLGLAIGAIFFLNYKLALLVCILIPLNVFGSKYFKNQAKKFYKESSDKQGILGSWLFEVIKGMREVSLLAADNIVLKKFTSKSIEVMRINIKSNRVEILNERFNSSISMVSTLVLYILAGYFVFKGEFTVGAFVASVDYFGRATSLFNGLSQKAIAIQGNKVGIERVQKILEEESENYEGEALIASEGSIKFENVHFSYNEQNEILDGVALNISGGEKIALVGKSGAGKSTLASLLLRFYEPVKGKIYIDGQDISKVSLESLRKSIGMVWQDTILFDGTIRDNMLVGQQGISDKEIWRALERAHLADFVGSLDNGLDTLLGTGAQGLSGGQKQRLAIARVFIKNPKILIFDEATSALDFESEQVIKGSWKELCEGRTILIIAHRLSTIVDSDKVAVLSEGKLVACANHAELLGNCSAYDEIYANQYIAEEEEEQVV
jgi:ABC-type multidrug transport system fused ATPase/permease subunit